MYSLVQWVLHVPFRVNTYVTPHLLTTPVSAIKASDFSMMVFRVKVRTHAGSVSALYGHIRLGWRRPGDRCVKGDYLGDT